MENDNLPDIVAQRMAEAGIDPEQRTVKGRTLCVRRLGSPLEYRENEAGQPLFRGYASVFDFPYTVGGGPEYGGYIETIDPTAFNRTLNATPDVSLLVEHEGLPLARTKSGTLALSTDESGLLVEASLDPLNPRAAEIISAMKRGDVDEMSFAFRTPPGTVKWNHNYTERVITEAALDFGDVTICPRGANPATVGGLMPRSSATSALVTLEYAQAVQMQLRTVGDSTVPGESFDDIRSAVQCAVNEAYGDSEYEWDSIYVDNLSTNWAVYSNSGQLYQISYEIGADGAVTLGEPVKVSRQTSYVELS